MSLFYGMSVAVFGHRPEAPDAIKDAATSEWPFGDWTEVDEKLSAYGEGILGGGETEREFSERFRVRSPRNRDRRALVAEKFAVTPCGLAKSGGIDS
jgi:hypothetical protein